MKNKFVLVNKIKRSFCSCWFWWDSSGL